jgi:glycosyltransferase involved in cell wall biosynthesis
MVSLSRGPTRRVALARLARSGNPYLDLLEENLAELGFAVLPDPPFTLRWLWRGRREVGFLHFHWRPDRYYVWRGPRYSRSRQPSRIQGALTWLTLVRFAARILAARALGYRIAWTIHEVLPPETRPRRPGSVSRRIDRVAGHLLARSSDLLLAHDRETAAQARDEFRLPSLRVEIVPHGSYIGVYPPGRPRGELRAELGLAEDDFVFLCFGALRPEKEIPLLVTAFEALGLSDVALVVAGNPEDAVSVRSVLHAVDTGARVIPILRTIPRGGVAELFAAADVFVISRSAAWTSGSVRLALSLRVPVVAPQLPMHEELLDGERAGWLFRPGDPDSLRDTLARAAADRAEVRAKGRAGRRRAESLPSWMQIARQCASLMLSEAEPERREAMSRPFARLVD